MYLSCAYNRSGDVILLVTKDTKKHVVFPGSDVRVNSCVVRFEHGGYEYPIYDKKDYDHRKKCSSIDSNVCVWHAHCPSRIEVEYDCGIVSCFQGDKVHSHATPSTIDALDAMYDLWL